MEKRYPIPPFTAETALEKIQLTQDAYNTHSHSEGCDRYAVDSDWRNHSEVIDERNQLACFLTGKWKKESNYIVKKEHWAYTENIIAVCFEYEYQDAQGKWYRAYGNENWEFDMDGLMIKRFASINDLEIKDIKEIQ
ncbi:histidine kinase [Chryseobacterium sp. Leaf405]|uniref:DUF1348 family protein n=1 Tax=Chryseobacterium sp. Leaf405 TaxID=1736367 RepID=UPI000700C6E2|nr:DUF1348 family protein [Chryseobacterium sp. Leaf405]KQT35799.1 histidine kinase [Chryseobacterium sp. Leaf405]